MPDVRVHRCTVRVVRRGGWSWGADPAALVRSVVQAVPGLVEEALRRTEWAHDAEGTIDQPIRVRVAARLSELAALASSRPADVRRPAGGGIAHDGSALASRVSGAVHAALEHRTPLVSTALATPHQSRASLPGSSTVSIDDLVDGPDPLAIALCIWREHGLIDTITALAPGTLEAWAAAASGILGGHADAQTRGPEAAGLSPPLTRAHGERIVSDDPPPPGPVPTTPRGAALTPSGSGELPTPRAPDSADSAPGAHARPDRVGQPAPRRVVESDTPAKTRGPDRNTRHASRTNGHPSRPTDVRHGPAPVSSDTHVFCALPLLMLGPLARAGYLGALAGALGGAGLADRASLWAFAFATKCLDPPERGWLRSARTVQAAAACAALQKPPDEPALTGFARACAPACAGLDAVLAASVIRGRTASRPLLLHAPSLANAALFDPDGLFMLGTGPIDALVPAIEACGRPMVLVPADSANPGVLSALDRAGVRFLTDAPPARNESWARLPRVAGVETWTNRSIADRAERHAVELDVLGERAADILRVLHGDNAAAPLAADPTLDRSLTIAACFALGTISWALWSDREASHPLLALRRFADLDARISYSTHAVRVCLPLGRRRADLFASGLLADVPGVPWLGSRRIEFAGG